MAELSVFRRLALTCCTVAGGACCWLAEPKLEERRLVGGDGLEPPTFCV